MPAPQATAQWTASSALAQTVGKAGFLYDPEQDMIYSKIDAWQQHVGFCYLYDDLTPVSISAVIDAEPVYFSSGGKDWMIELWKGQYGLETGAEIGVYSMPAHSSVVTAVADSLAKWFPTVVGHLAQKVAHEFKLYACSTKQPLDMAFTLTRKSTKEAVLHREGKHWWLTGFKWGEYAEPEDLAVDARITLLDRPMRDAFLKALHALKYTDVQTPDDKSVRFTFDKPKTAQSSVRASLRKTVQANNKTLVDAYNDARKSLGVTTNDPNVIQEKLGQTPVFQRVTGFLNLVIASEEKLKAIIKKL